MLAMAFLTPMTVPISRVSKVWGRNLSRETLSNIGQHPLHLGFETPVQNHVPQPDHHAGHDLPVDDLLDVDRPSHVRREDRVQPFALRLGERKRNGDFDRLGLELRSWPVGLPDLLDELVDQMRVDGLSHRGREDAPEDVRRQAHERNCLDENELPEEHRRYRTNRWKMTMREITAIDSAKTNARIIDVWIFGEADGFRARARMLPYPMTAITKDGPSVLMIRMRMIVRFLNAPPGPAARSGPPGPRPAGWGGISHQPRSVRLSAD